ncbi:MAG: response regulator [Elusimicrobia bacterium]|nr:response regulator [Elusimicrobiota bacterium]
MKFLVVDDEAEIRELLKVFLSSDGSDVVLLDKGEKVIKTIRKEQFSLILLDINLPDINGIDLLKQIRSADPELPVMMITGFKDAENVVAAFREGAVDCILKPLDFEYLKTSIFNHARK